MVYRNYNRKGALPALAIAIAVLVVGVIVITHIPKTYNGVIEALTVVAGN